MLEGPLLPGAALLDLAPTILSCIRDESYSPASRHKTIAITHAIYERGRAESRGCSEGESSTQPVFSVYHRSSFHASGRAETG
jgi:hypothetical protein